MTEDKKPEFSDKELKVHIRHILLHEFLRGSKPSVVIKEVNKLYGDEIMSQPTETWLKHWTFLLKLLENIKQDPISIDISPVIENTKECTPLPSLSEEDNTTKSNDGLSDSSE
ncbi:hypothetical protein CONCODRAFT_9142 [Conidiobolus coronatus NRRL 28638]|uniref:Mos1 transposase HTH domain-containing protein n=1 Tax=Conidiobolus coronatus (strain ATCC 28846 / CBS 209.66 / NRRL 28638) TaxID=796925 RepID=A0A137P0D1_CONC2|nr:hypothetical protein CONCODRAFT_9142 [Conidiobolus coronatus NRRL 28638]|eukprot:KXN68550.1 hypothetical protein CONCODRAFT_9142 [Conidiobolus coronatus NRRL 28638]